MAEDAQPDSRLDIGQFKGMLKSDIAVVTGAAMGNGAAIARGLALCGARVVATDRDAEALAPTVEAIRAEGGDIVGMTGDVSTMADCDALAESVAREVGPASILINNAGIVRRVLTDDDGFVASVEAQLSVNAMGSVQMVKAFLPQLKQTRGRVVNLGSIASFRSTTGGVGYGMSKGSVLLMTQTLAAELAPFGIRVNGIAPGVIATPMTLPTRSNPETVKKYYEHIPFGRFGEPEELVGPALFLVSAQSSYVTGVMLPVDGGFLSM
ncbi:SDR family NAD(P)-dependent oxidoreductase [Pseudodonghicola flavimaris]|uniref:SDR family oxidoreductase n=1 Tax=Pseudodonghicola flavimaris TaxID=3050036 RepID=A0ABT7F1B7_9RHOB|nr:SDR family oxidoreductase [Pseudodonghicola flavimaris]MDK3018399.1 SDR family oxidoreductase [Pseudodonghicola flavimaris]